MRLNVAYELKRCARVLRDRVRPLIDTPVGVCSARAMRIPGEPIAPAEFFERVHAGETDFVPLMTWRTGDGDTTIRVVTSAGAIGTVPDARRWSVVVRGVSDVDADDVDVSIDGERATYDMRYEDQSKSLIVDVSEPVGHRALFVTFRGGLGIALNPVLDDARQVLHDAQIRYRVKDKAYELLERQGAHALPALCALPDREDDVSDGLPKSVIGALSEVLFRV